MHSTYPDDPGFLAPPDWDDDHGLAETTWDRRSARISLELQLVRLGFDPSLEVSR